MKTQQDAFQNLINQYGTTPTAPEQKEALDKQSKTVKEAYEKAAARSIQIKNETFKGYKKAGRLDSLKSLGSSALSTVSAVSGYLPSLPSFGSYTKAQVEELEKKWKEASTGTDEAKKTAAFNEYEKAKNSYEASNKRLDVPTKFINEEEKKLWAEYTAANEVVKVSRSAEELKKNNALADLTYEAAKKKSVELKNKDFQGNQGVLNTMQDLGAMGWKHKDSILHYGKMGYNMLKGTAKGGRNKSKNKRTRRFVKSQHRPTRRFVRNRPRRTRR